MKDTFFRKGERGGGGQGGGEEGLRLIELDLIFSFPFDESMERGAVIQKRRLMYKTPPWSWKSLGGNFYLFSVRLKTLACWGC